MVKNNRAQYILGGTVCRGIGGPVYCGMSGTLSRGITGPVCAESPLSDDNDLKHLNDAYKPEQDEP
jgi:hypothetical protein